MGSNFIGILHYLNSTKWSDSINEIYFILHNLTTLVSTGHSLIPLLEYHYRGDILKYWQPSNVFFFVNYFYLYTIENTGYRPRSVGKVFFWYVVLLYFINGTFKANPDDGGQTEKDIEQESYLHDV